MIPAQLIIDILTVHRDNPMYSYNRIAKKLCVNYSVVRVVMSKNVLSKNRVLSIGQEQQILEMIKTMRVKEIALNLKCEVWTVYAFLKKSKIEIKSINQNR